jgi:hypothetical protein
VEGIKEKGRAARSPAGGSVTKDAVQERPPTSLRTVAAGRPRGLLSEVLVLDFLDSLASAFRHIVVAHLRRGRANRTSRKFEDEGRDEKGNDHSVEDSRMRTGEQCGQVNRQGDHQSLGGVHDCWADSSPITPGAAVLRSG